MKLKISDIAEKAGVSKAAVSFALNGKAGVSEKTRKHIFKVIEEMGYEPLRKHKKGGVRKLTSISLVIIKTTTGLMNRSYASLPFFDSLVSNLSQNVGGSGGQVQIVTLNIRNLKQDIENSTALKKSKAAIVLATDLNKKQILFLDSKIKNAIFIDNYFEDVDADFVSIDNFQGGYNAGKFIIEKGYTQIGYVASNRIITNFLKRREGFRTALKEKNLEIPPDFVFSLNPVELRGTLPKFFYSNKKYPHAIFCEDDYMALRLVKELTKIGIKIPDQLAIMGFDDIFEDTMINPELTTIHVPIEQIVRQAINQLEEKVSNTHWLSQKSFISTKLIVRESLK
ncbi:LacI family transcriptional regulator [Lactobacillus johnsonii]|jgi:LacI family transcriptional regulator|uniref:LacI family DNA-binding transcriptional regulator n=1 Tax=Lactobacillus johnsonii TaxID=33959 RepID=UPI001071A3A5|nr:LacI family DNA-binding transcriptional regulator [Lactobacillus johnsonii]MBF0771117.1 LacI family DNA-binding transcriptional regulator [Lactobacillus johnsonii]MCF1582762.1 LacI family DNA-binding transcriptional regulator [Lactobacillus johnsonii]MCI9451047.1 LacI family transcriptional regulator [Lactobacillus johnsonii]MDG4987905.1 LacI family DNA-binding transcriptional regulator [Lactobacillus johnsonii]NDO44518.1 LacI family transcriptional regulator [Lactobacillus johnsonii]